MFTLPSVAAVALFRKSVLLPPLQKWLLYDPPNEGHHDDTRYLVYIVTLVWNFHNKLIAVEPVFNTAPHNEDTEHKAGVIK